MGIEELWESVSLKSPQSQMATASERKDNKDIVIAFIFLFLKLKYAVKLKSAWGNFNELAPVLTKRGVALKLKGKNIWCLCPESVGI